MSGWRRSSRPAPRTSGSLRIFDPEHADRAVIAAGRAVVHDHLRPRLAAHLVDGPAARPVAGARHDADAGQPAGLEGDPGDRGGAGQDPARDAVRDAGVAVAGRQQRLLRHRRRDAAVRDAPRRAAPVGPGTPGRGRAAPPCRPGAGLDRELRRQGRRRLRRVRPVHRARPGQPGLEGLLRRHQLRQRRDRRAADRAGRGPGLRLRRLPGQVALLHRARGRRRRRLLGAQGPGAQGRLQPGRSGCRTRGTSPSAWTATSGRSTRWPPTWATACGPASSTRARRPPSPGT